MIFVLFLLFTAAAAARQTSEGAGIYSSPVRVMAVNDGDTLTVRIRGRAEKIRLIGIDAPEMGQRPWGSRAKEHLQSLVSSSEWNVDAGFDVVQRDKYGRILAYIFSKNGELLNTRMIRDGYAVMFTLPPNVKYAGEFAEAQRQARERKLGIWGRDGLKQLPVDYRKTHPRSR